MYNYFSLFPLNTFLFLAFSFLISCGNSSRFQGLLLLLGQVHFIHFKSKGLSHCHEAKGNENAPSQWFTGRTGPRKPSWLVQDSFRQDVAAATNPLLAPWNKAQKGQVSLGPDGVIRKALTPKTLTLTLRILTIESKQNRK